MRNERVEIRILKVSGVWLAKYWALESYAAFTLNGFGDQERNLRLVKAVFPLLKLKFLACNMKQAFYPFHKQNIARAWQ